MPDGTSDLTDLQVLITAEEAYPALERAFLDAKTEIWASFRIFDLETRLRSEEGREIGQTWFDLIVHVLRQNVALHFILSDFDPVVAPELHMASWRARRAFEAAGDAAGDGAQLLVQNALHDARVGLLPRMVLWRRLRAELAKTAADLNAAPEAVRTEKLTSAPALRPLMTEKPDGSLAPRIWPPPPLVPATHHQKIAVFDRSLLCVGGLDLDERRYDDKAHRRDHADTWHDVQLMCRGPAALEAQAHLERFLNMVSDTCATGSGGRVLRTLSRKRRFSLPHLGPKPVVRELADAHMRMIGRARDLLYFETQFFRDPHLAECLAKAGQAKPDLGLIMVLPGAPEDVAFEDSRSLDARYGEYLQVRAVETVQAAFGDRAVFCSPVRPKHIAGEGRDRLEGSPIIYVHAKVSIFDDRAAIVSSANLNGRSLYWDTEAGLALSDGAQVAGLRQRVFRHWLGPEADPACYATGTAAAAWRALVEANATAAPDDRMGFLVPYDVAPAKSFGRPLPGVPSAMV